ncbi:response regulator [Trichlorobacter ammonificans]|uniref:DNA-binding transcriptional activator CusR n=1 Tax=Trichlorobacter ammonificans TaxID=2916410 RepID=A0ABM9D999_9BACT|nr:response regulator transcription factor [Trichlorobacter ammonificans]CAH2031813.1 DNA-binding transcriptional activator CusR [Trichlorobacter ammonificans]
MRILIIEDEQKIAEALKRGLEAEGYEAVTAVTGEEGFYCLSTEFFNLLLLDLMLPGRDGLEILTTIRDKGYTLPVLVLTGRDTVEDRVLGLDSGADDYLVKPFAFPELLARIRLLLRRGRPEPMGQVSLADLELNLSTHQALRDGQLLDLTQREFELLEYLLRHQEHVVSREMLAHDIWKVKERSTPLDNVIDVNIARLRRKVDGPFARKLIRTIRGVGFMATVREAHEPAH